MDKNYIKLVEEKIESFKQEVYNSINDTTYIYIDSENYNFTPRKTKSEPNPENKVSLKAEIVITTGGCIGGNYMGDEAIPFRGFFGPHPDIKELGYSVLEEIEKNIIEHGGRPISFLQARNLLKDCITINNTEEREYYGNFSEKSIISLDFHKLYNNLVEKDLYFKNKKSNDLNL